MIVAIAVAALLMGCSRERIVRVGWDPPAVAPDRYLILVDDRVVQEIPPPPLDAACRCLMASVSVPRGTHTIKIVAYSRAGGRSVPSAAVTVQ